jgi:glyoxylase I family protein
MAPPDTDEQARLAQRREDLRRAHIQPPADRPATNGRGIHHAALICSDVEQTIAFYQGLLGFPLIELVENRDYPGSTHFFFDLGNDTLLGFFDFPGLGLEAAPEGFGGVQHIAISVPPDVHAVLRTRLDERGISDGIGIELLADDLMWFGGLWLDGRA